MTHQAYTFEWKELQSFGALALGAVIASMMSSLSDTPISKWVRVLCHVAVLAGTLLLLILRLNGEEKTSSKHPEWASPNAATSGPRGAAAPRPAAPPKQG